MEKYNVKIAPSLLSGCVTAPPSKSISHRALICAALADGESVISNLAFSQDILATIDVLSAIGAKIENIDDSTLKVQGIGGKPRSLAVLGCRESGSTLRFMIPICLLSPDEFKLSGSEKLLSRPLGIYADIFKVRYCGSDEKVLTIAAGESISAGDYRIPGNVSSQFITGFLFILPYLKKNTRIHITTEIESRSYIEMTLEAMRSFGIDIGFENENTLLMRGGEYSPREVCVEGDWSGAAFPDALNLFGGEVEISGLNTESLQGDRVYRSLYKSLAKGYAEISIEDCPDLGPILFTLAAALHGGHFTGTARLRIKESDRAAVMAEELSKFGAELLIEENSVTVKKTELHSPKSTLNGHGDHRIVMALAILATLYGGEIDGAEAISKSYPAFFDDMRRLGIKITLN